MNKKILKVLLWLTVFAGVFIGTGVIFGWPAAGAVTSGIGIFWAVFAGANWGSRNSEATEAAREKLVGKKSASNTTIYYDDQGNPDPDFYDSEGNPTRGQQ